MGRREGVKTDTRGSGRGTIRRDGERGTRRSTIEKGERVEDESGRIRAGKEGRRDREQQKFHTSHSASISNT